MKEALRAAIDGQSRTINGNVIAAPMSVIIVWLARMYGLDMPPEVSAAFVALIMGGLNIAMRFLTSLPLEAKARKA